MNHSVSGVKKQGKFEFQKWLRVNYEVKRVNLSQFSERKRWEVRRKKRGTITFNQNENFVVRWGFVMVRSRFQMNHEESK